jgi:DNA-binding Lrp family transcriptional regulator
LIRVRVENIPELERLVEKLRRDPNIVRTRTLIVLSTIVDGAGPFVHNSNDRKPR